MAGDLFKMAEAAAYNIRIARHADGIRVQKFIHDHWRNNHQLATSQALFDWQHWDKARSCYNFVIAEHSQSGEIHAILGFIPVSQFDTSLEDNRDYWLAIWKVREDTSARGLGLSLLLFLRAERKPRSIAAVGLSRLVVPIYQRLGYHTGKLDHWYILNPKVREYRLARVPAGVSIKSNLLKKSCTLNVVTRTSEFSMGSYIPTKSLKYIEERYINHPTYNYFVVEALCGGRSVGLCVYRTIETKLGRAVRIVDLASSQDENFDFLHETVFSAFDETGAEYADFYCLGYSAVGMGRAGFSLRTSSPGLIIPNYFEPFVQQNVDLDYAYWVTRDVQQKYRFVKGDSDQDRPSWAGGVV